VRRCSSWGRIHCSTGPNRLARAGGPGSSIPPKARSTAALRVPSGPVGRLGAGRSGGRVIPLVLRSRRPVGSHWAHG
jgi:hypothetical protein